MRALHVFEEWDQLCTASVIVAEVVEGETWAWHSDRLDQSVETSVQDPEWWNVDSAKHRITAFVQMVDCPQEIDAKWIEDDDVQPVGNGPWVVKHLFKRMNCSDACGGLQLVQVMYSTPNPDVPMHMIDGWSCCVDAGRNSVWARREGRAPAHPTRPYYYPPRIYRVEGSAGTIKLVDDVGAAFGHEQVYLEAAAVCIGHIGGDRDSLLGVLRYGWAEWGDVAKPHPGAPPGPPEEAQDVSDMFRAIVEHDYPTYSKLEHA